MAAELMAMEAARQKAYNFSSVHRIGYVAQKAVELLQVLIRSDVDPEKLLSAVKLLEGKRLLMEACSKTRENVLHQLTCGLSKCLEMTLNLYTEKKRAFSIEPLEMEFGDDVEILEDYSSENEKEAEERAPKKIKIANGKNGFECKVCGKKYSTYGNYKNHLKIPHAKKPTNPEKPFECDVCGQSFSQKPVLERHQFGHGIIIPRFLKFKCDVCDKILPSWTDLERHMKKHNDPDAAATDPFKCGCGKLYSNAAKMRQHLEARISNKCEPPPKYDESVLPKKRYDPDKASRKKRRKEIQENSDEVIEIDN